MMDALSHGLPMVMIPIGADQLENAQSCLKAGVTRVIEPERCTAEAIRDTVSEVLLDTSYRENAQRIRREMEELPGLKYPVTLLEKLAAEHNTLVP